MEKNHDTPETPGIDKSAFASAHANSYVEATLNRVPGLAALHRMTSMLLRERAPERARILAVGAGGGLELKALADDNPGWTFHGVDPSADMLRLAEQTVGQHLPRIHLQEGYIDAAPEGPFDAATCLLTLHFVGRDQRVDTLEQIRRRLMPGAPFVVAHISFPQSEPERSTWIARHVAFDANASGNPENARQAIATRLSILSPEEDEAMLYEAGFSGVSLFYAALSFKGWVGYA